MLIGRQLHRDIVNSVNPRDSIVLDLGVGKGRMVSDFVSREPRLLVCADINPTMLTSTKESLKHERKNRAECILCDAEKLPFRTCSFDFVVCIGLLMHLNDPNEAFSEFSRIMKDSGFLITDNVNNSIVGHLCVVGLNVFRIDFLQVLKNLLITGRLGSDISTSYSLKEHQDFHFKAGLRTAKAKTYGNKYFPWIFLTFGKKEKYAV